MNSLDNLYMAAVKAAKETEEFVGGFDIMQKLQKKLHKEQQEPQEKEALMTVPLKL